ncbi:MAG TPA: hypothetical protein VKC57_06670, partial [Ktedonobacterales bacterium]|nr:hypothetical protein [Ktedonobacterales bacterium]
LLATCDSTATVTISGGGSPTASSAATATHTGGGPTATPVPAPPHAFAWIQFDGSHNPQIWASINGGTPAQITHYHFSGSGCNPTSWGLPVFSPDLTHIASVLGFICGDGPVNGTVEIINVSNGAYTPIPTSNSGALANQRSYGWVNNNTVWILNYGGLYEYTLGAGSPTLLPGISNGVEGVLRGNTFFFSNMVSTPTIFTLYLYRYDMTSHTVLSTINLGTIHGCQCSPGDAHYQGWDASPDGSHVAYQVTTAGPGPDFGISHSTIYYANADGSGASQIASYMFTTSLVRMLISPNGQLVAFSNALPSPSVVSASVNSPGHSGDPNFHTYTPAAVAFPVWKWDSSQFWAATAEDSDAGYTHSNLMNYHIGTSAGVVGVAGGYNPWYTIGG